MIVTPYPRGSGRCRLVMGDLDEGRAGRPEKVDPSPEVGTSA